MTSGYADRRVVVVGAGIGAGAHLRALREIGCQVVGVVTHHPDRAAAVRALFPETRVCWPATDALDLGADLAIVASPAGTHLGVVREAAHRGIDVVVEKPLEARLDRAAGLVAVTRDSGVGLAVCFQHRAKPAGRALRSLVDGGVLGAFTGGAVTVPWWRPQSYYDVAGRGSYDRDGGGVLITQTIHTLDLFLSVAGPPERVRADASRVAQRMEAEDTILGVLDYGAGRLAPVYATVAAYPGRDEELSISGTAGTAVVRGADLLRYAAVGAEPEVVVDGSADAGGSTAADPGAMPTAWHRALLEDAMESFAAGREPLAGGASALVTQRVVAAMYRSAGTGGWVDLDDPALAAEPEASRPMAGTRPARTA
jgi:UDP-N-acetyl-2-amino-2-deoxyglucuronate dehydrogenase